MACHHSEERIHYSYCHYLSVWPSLWRTHAVTAGGLSSPVTSAGTLCAHLQYIGYVKPRERVCVCLHPRGKCFLLCVLDICVYGHFYSPTCVHIIDSYQHSTSLSSTQCTTTLHSSWSLSHTHTNTHRPTDTHTHCAPHTSTGVKWNRAECHLTIFTCTDIVYFMDMLNKAT